MNIDYKNRPQGLETKIGGCREGVKLTFFLLSDRWNTLWTPNLVLIPASPLKNGQVNKIIDNRTHRKGFAQAEKDRSGVPTNPRLSFRDLGNINKQINK